MNPALEQLLKSQPGVWRGSDRYHDSNALPTGFSQLDAILPANGWGTGSLTELLVSGEGIGEFSLLLPALQRITAGDQWAALINPPYVPYAPALGNAGIRLDRLLIVDSDCDKNTLWATEQVLRTGTFTAVITWLGRSSAQQQRRLQLAAETGRCCALAYRAHTARSEHSPAALRIMVSAVDAQLHLDVIKARGGREQAISINPIEFDRPQGTDWPVGQAPSTSAMTRAMTRGIPGSSDQQTTR